MATTMSDMMADIRADVLTCADDVDAALRRAGGSGSFSTAPLRLRRLESRLKEYERAVEQLIRAGPPTPRDTTPTDGDAA